MASKRFEKGSEEWDLFQDYWKLCQRFWVPEEKDDYWASLLKALDDFQDKYKNEPLAQELALALWKSSEKRSARNE